MVAKFVQLALLDEVEGFLEHFMVGALQGASQVSATCLLH
jgi:hypothetical protein